jgi:hypothetical protein
LKNLGPSSEIEIEKIGEGDFRVRVIQGASASTHHVSLKANDFERLSAGKVAPEELVRRSFEFLLEREPKESILARSRAGCDRPDLHNLFSLIPPQANPNHSQRRTDQCAVQSCERIKQNEITIAGCGMCFVDVGRRCGRRSE